MNYLFVNKKGSFNYKLTQEQNTINLVERPPLTKPTVDYQPGEIEYKETLYIKRHVFMPHNPFKRFALYAEHGMQDEEILTMANLL